MLKEETILELKKVLKEDYGQDLLIQEASEAARILVGYFDLLAKTYYQNMIKGDKIKEQKMNFDD